MTSPPDDRSAMGLALSWVARVMAVSLEMFIPGLIGEWLDRRLETSFLTILGFALGLVGGVTHLLIMVRVTDRESDTKNSGDKPPRDEPRRDNDKPRS